MTRASFKKPLFPEKKGSEWANGWPWYFVGATWLLLWVWNVTDRTPPIWDQAGHLVTSWQHWKHLQQFVPTALWWDSFFKISDRYPPLIYWLATPFFQLFGFSLVTALVVPAAFLLLLAFGTAGLTQALLDEKEARWVGALAAGLVMLYPIHLEQAHQFLLDLPMATAILWGFWGCARYWRQPSWFHSLWIGICLGWVGLTKWSGILFLVVPLVALLIRQLHQKEWRCLLHAGLVLLSAAVIIAPWYGTNWLFVISNGLKYARDAQYYPVIAGSPGSWDWWTFYLRILPFQMSWWLVGLPLLCVACWSGFPKFLRQKEAVVLLLLVFSSGYVIVSWISLKDPRFSMPLLPLLAILSAIGLAQLPKPAASGAFVMLSLLTLATFWNQTVLPSTQKSASLLTGVAEYLQKTIPLSSKASVGMLPVNANSLPLGPEELDYYSAVSGRPFVARVAGITGSTWEPSLWSWVLRCAGPCARGWTDPYQDQRLSVAKVLDDPSQFQRVRTWPLGGQDSLELYQRVATLTAPLTVIEEGASAMEAGNLELLGKDILVLTQTQYDAAYLEASRQLLMPFGQSTVPRKLYGAALTYVIERRVPEAQRILAQITEQTPQDAQAWGYRAFLYLYTFRPQAALSALDKLDALNPKPNPLWWQLRAIAYAQSLNFVGAWQTLQVHPTHEPNPVD
jgi:4-amino-4-deoxy-L-arabinose transferase-like glycosyltransferase